MSGGIGGATWETATTFTANGVPTSLTPYTVAGAAGPSRPYWPAWWKWTALENGELYLNTFSSDLNDDPTVNSDTIIEVWEGDPLVRLVYADDTSETVPPNHVYLSSHTLAVQTGKTYYIKVGSYGSDPDPAAEAGIVDFYALNGTFTPAPPPPSLQLIEDFELGTDGLGVSDQNTNIDSVRYFSGSMPPASSYVVFTADRPHGGGLCAVGRGGGFTEDLVDPHNSDALVNVEVDDSWWQRFTFSAAGSDTFVWRVGTGLEGSIRNSTTGRIWPLQVWLMTRDNVRSFWLRLITHPQFVDVTTDISMGDLPVDTWLKFHVQFSLEGDASLVVSDDTGAQHFEWSQEAFLTEANFSTGRRVFGHHVWKMYASNGLTTWLDDINTAPPPVIVGEPDRVRRSFW